MNNALCRALLVILQSANPSAGTVLCSGGGHVVTSSGLPTATAGETETIRMEQDGTYVIAISRFGGLRTETRITPDSRSYQALRQQVGEIPVGDTIQVSP